MAHCNRNMHEDSWCWYLYSDHRRTRNGQKWCTCLSDCTCVWCSNYFQSNLHIHKAPSLDNSIKIMSRIIFVKTPHHTCIEHWIIMINIIYHFTKMSYMRFLFSFSLLYILFWYLIFWHPLTNIDLVIPNAGLIWSFDTEMWRFIESWHSHVKMWSTRRSASRNLEPNFSCSSSAYKTNGPYIPTKP